MSMQKAANVTGGLVSRQTVNNKLLSMKAPVTAMERVKNTPSELHIFADEDHVHLRPRKSAFVPLVTITDSRPALSLGPSIPALDFSQKLLTRSNSPVFIV